MLVFRLCRSCSKVPLKIVHAIIQAAALVFAAVGLAAAFDYHDRDGLTDMYTLHSWLGLIVVILFGLQVPLTISIRHGTGSLGHRVNGSFG